jgi:hypothetical protein
MNAESLPPETRSLIEALLQGELLRRQAPLPDGMLPLLVEMVFQRIFEIAAAIGPVPLTPRHLGPIVADLCEFLITGIDPIETRLAAAKSTLESLMRLDQNSEQHCRRDQ